MKITISSLENKHFPVMLDEVIQACLPASKNSLIIDCTFGGGGYSKELLKFPNINVVALDRDKSTINRAKYLEKVYPTQFSFHNNHFRDSQNLCPHDPHPEQLQKAYLFLNLIEH